jgi:hypothetical protein
MELFCETFEISEASKCMLFPEFPQIMPSDSQETLIVHIGIAVNPFL